MELMKTNFEAEMRKKKQTNECFENESNLFNDLFMKIKTNMQREGFNEEVLKEC